MSSLRGWPSSDKNADTLAPHVTVEPMSPELHGLTVRAMIAAYNVATDLTEAGSTVKLINATAHVARPGDVIRMISGPAQSDEAKVVAVTPNSIQLATKLSAAPTTGNQFAVLRPRQMQVDDQGNLIVTSTSGPVQFVRDNIDTEVNEDTVTPANSRPLPVKLFYGNGQSDVAEDVTASLALIEGATQATAQDIDALNDNFGAQNAAVATTDTGTFSFMAFVKRMLQKLTSIDTSNAAIAVDTASISASNAQIQAYTNVIATNTTNGNILTGPVNETAPASDTASSGLNGRLQRIAQRLTSLIALFPTSLGQKAMSASFAVTLASDQTAIPTASPINAAGTVVNNSVTGTTAQSHAAPANAVGFILENDSTSLANMRWGVGSTASSTVGLLLEPGRDTGFVPIGAGATISIAALGTGATSYAIQWIQRV